MKILESAQTGLILTEADKQSVVWMKIVKHLEDRKREMQAKLCGDLDTEQTWKMRGRVAEVEGIIAAGQDVPDVNTDFK